MTWQFVGNIAGQPADTTEVEGLRKDVTVLTDECAFLRKCVLDQMETVKSLSGEIRELRETSSQVQVLPTITPVVDTEAIVKAVIETVEATLAVEMKANKEAVESMVLRAVSDLPKPKDGIGILGALIDREGHLVVTLSDGVTKELGVVIGQPGRDVDMAAVADLVKREIASWPRPKDGLDGFGFDDLDLEHDGERTVTLRFTKGERTKSWPITFPVDIYRGVWEPEKSYERGDTVTFGGNHYIAKKATSQKPGETPDGVKDWQLAVPKGRVGREGPQGAPGKDGKDFKGEPWRR